jgi:hypothetical protein
VGTDRVSYVYKAADRWRRLATYQVLADASNNAFPPVSGPRLVAQPVFSGTSCNENSLIATDRSIVVENNFGTRITRAQPMGRRRSRTWRELPWTRAADATRSGLTGRTISDLVSKMSLANGLIYTYTKPRGPANADPWYLTAIDFENRYTVFKQLAGRAANAEYVLTEIA